jgi:hypothetical protein
MADKLEGMPAFVKSEQTREAPLAALLRHGKPGVAFTSTFCFQLSKSSGFRLADNPIFLRDMQGFSLQRHLTQLGPECCVNQFGPALKLAKI